MLNSEHLIVKNLKDFPIEKMEGKDWQPVLDKGIKILDEHGMNWQLGSGTLLGIIREKDGYIHHDTDIDIDIMINSVDKDLHNARVDGIVQDFEKNGFELVRLQLYAFLPMQVAFLHKDNDLLFDLCFYYDGFGTDYVNVYEHGLFLRPPYSVKDIGLFEFKGKEYRIPYDYNKYLNGRYGKDWKTPKKYKESGEKDAANYLVIL